MRLALPTLAAAALAGSTLSASPALAQDDLVTAKGRIIAVKALGDDVLVVSDRPRDKPHRIQRLVDGRLAGASALTGSGVLVNLEHPGRDRAGRVVVPFLRAERLTSDGHYVGLRWLLYDVEHNTTRRLRGLPGGKDVPTHVAIWRDRTAYALDSVKRVGVHLRDAAGARRLTKLRVSDFDDPLVLRGRNLVMVSGAGDATFTLNRILDGGERTVAPIEPSTGEADGSFRPVRVWMTGRRVSWLAETSTTAGNLVLGTDLAGGGSDPGPVGAYPATEELPLALDGDRLYTADGRELQVRDAGEPSTAAPANDAVANAQALSGSLPITVGTRIGFATATPDEPAITGEKAAGGVVVGTAKATRTIWYAYKPAAAGPVKLTASVAFGAIRGGDLRSGAVAVYDDPGTGTLTPVPAENDGIEWTATFDADPTHRYLVGLGADSALPAWPSFTLQLQAG